MNPAILPETMFPAPLVKGTFTEASPMPAPAPKLKSQRSVSGRS